MNFWASFLSAMTLIQSLPSHLSISALASFGVVQRFRLEGTHQKDQFRLTDQGVCQYSLSMNSVAPLQVGARSEFRSRKELSLHRFGGILTLCLSTTSNTKLSAKYD
jgi:hypothetical protein